MNARRHQPRARSAAELERQIASFNQRYPVGTPVAVRRDDGKSIVTATRSEAWIMSGHSAVIMVDGISGGYLLDRVSPVAGPDA